MSYCKKTKQQKEDKRKSKNSQEGIVVEVEGKITDNEDFGKLVQYLVIPNNKESVGVSRRELTVSNEGANSDVRERRRGVGNTDEYGVKQGNVSQKPKEVESADEKEKESNFVIYDSTCEEQLAQAFLYLTNQIKHEEACSGATLKTICRTKVLYNEENELKSKVALVEEQMIQKKSNEKELTNISWKIQEIKLDETETSLKTRKSSMGEKQQSITSDSRKEEPKPAADVVPLDETRPQQTNIKPEDGARPSRDIYWGVTREETLPASVVECFEDSTSLLARLQGRLFPLLGRGNRYSLPSTFSVSPGMPLEVLRRKVKEARHKLFRHSRSSQSKSSKKDKSMASESSSASEASVPAVSCRQPEYCTGVDEPLQKYWGGEDGTGGAMGEEEIELLQQFLNLQHLAKSRKHSAQLRRIRDSLLLKVRSRPNSLLVPQDPSLPHPAQASKHDRQQLRDFLLDIGFVQDYSLLNRHGYDLATAAHMDALDLAGAGVTEPLHRMALKHELNLVQRPPQVPEEVPETVEQWLEGLGLTDYVDNFHLNGIYCPLAALNLTKRDLQLMGVYMQGHRKKILLSLAALKESLFRRQ